MCARFEVGLSMKQARHLRKVLRQMDKSIRLPDALRQERELKPSEQSTVLIHKGWKNISWGYPFNGKRLINARIESVLEKRIYREGIQAHRCAIPVKSYFEWDAKKQKYSFIHDFLCLAGLILKKDQEEYFVVMTKDAYDGPDKIHHRMPVLLEAEKVAPYLNQSSDIKKLLNNLNKDQIDLNIEAVGPQQLELEDFLT